MIFSRVLPSLIKLNRMINLTNASYSRLLIPSSFSVINRNSGPAVLLKFATMSTDIDKEMNEPSRHFDYNQLVAKKDQANVVVIDVREHSEINETGKIPGSIHIPLAELGKALGELSDEDFRKQYSADKPKKDNEIIFSCKAGGRSLKALKIGLELGYNKAGNYKGGWLDWAEKTNASK